ncbi:MAG: hypothetical protein IPP43_12680 [Chitinophagaceae bacterium]|nr:hypothetical protein [Chitinophagaceae bacterium]
MESRKYQLTIRCSAASVPAQLIILINTKKVNFNISNKDLSELTVGDFYLKKGENKIKIWVKSNLLRMDWIKFN